MQHILSITSADSHCHQTPIFTTVTHEIRLQRNSKIRSWIFGQGNGRNGKEEIEKRQ